MENNRYHLHRREIAEICERENVDISTACAMLRHEKGWEFPQGDTEITAFCEHVSQLQDQVKAGQIDHNTVKCYFYDC